LCCEAIRLGRLLVELLPDEPECTGLLALMLLTDARRAARTDDTGQLVPLATQDRAQWDRALITEGHSLVRRCLERNQPGPYQIQAAINAVHCDAPDAGLTDWQQILALYDLLAALAPSPVVTLNRAVALAEIEGPDVALRIVEALELRQYPPYHSVRADLLRRSGRTAEAAEAYQAAMALTTNGSEHAFLARRYRELAAN
jgi:RNA polymerase sigma-70 factor (ECF subfamily)